VLDVASDNFFARVRRTHRRNINRAIRLDFRSGALEHMKLIGASMERRANLGEEVVVHQSGARPMALLNSVLGELSQTVDGDILSSILILRSSQGAYGQSAGTRPEGMEIGASLFLLSWMATTVLKKRVRGCLIWEGTITPFASLQVGIWWATRCAPGGFFLSKIECG